MSAPGNPLWHEKYPAPRHAPPNAVDKSVVAQAIKNNTNDYIILDVRRDDFKGGKIKGALNIPAQAIYNSIGDLYKLAQDSHKKNIFVHCGSSKGRASRVCGWLEDEAEDKKGDVTCAIIEGGIKAWAAGGKEYTDLMDEYDPSAFE